MSIVDSLKPTVAAVLKPAEDGFRDTAGIVANTMGDMAADVIRGTGTVSSAVVNMVGNKFIFPMLMFKLI
jgi:hypothetical protein